MNLFKDYLVDHRERYSRVEEIFPTKLDQKKKNKQEEPSRQKKERHDTDKVILSDEAKRLLYIWRQDEEDR